MTKARFEIAVIATLAFAVATMATQPAEAQGYPSKAIRVVVPFAPGGGADVVGRLVAQKLTEGFKQQAIVENRAGAAGRVGAEQVAKSGPDGHTLLLATSSLMITAPALYGKLSYDVQKDFAPVALVAAGSYVLVVHPSVPARTVRELISLARSKSGALNYASSGPGGPAHLAGELFKAMAGVNMVHVPYKGSAPGTIAVLAGETDLMFSNISPAVPAIQSKRLRAIAITSAKRSSIIPALPTIAESGLPGFNVETFYGVLAPAGTPRDIVGRLNTEIVKAFDSADVRKRLESDGSEVLVSSPDAFAKVITDETAKWTKVIRDAGIKPE
jgi:tripartite-type tricarboxylate transporter receptor subunit TctC